MNKIMKEYFVRYWKLGNEGKRFLKDGKRIKWFLY